MSTSFMTDPSEQGEQALRAWPAELVILRADSREDLIATIEQYAAWMASDEAPDFTALAQSLARDLLPGGERIAFVATDAEQLGKLLERAAKKLRDPKCQRIKDVAGIYWFSEPLGLQGKVGWLFPGEGTQSLGMIRELDLNFPEVKSSLDWCDRVAESAPVPIETVSRFTRIDPNADPELRAKTEAELKQFDNAMFAVLMADTAVAAMFREFGVPCDAAAGHSAGELSALIATETMIAEDTIGQVVTTMRFLDDRESSDEEGAVLLAIGTSRAVVEEILAEAQTQSAEPLAARLAMDNCPHQCIVVGLPDAMAIVEPIVAARKLMHERLSLARPYHTEMFAPYMGPLREMFEASEFRAPTVPMYACATGERFPDDPDSVRELVLAHWVSRVEFTRLLNAMHEDGVRVFVEVGPRGMLSSFVEDALRGKPAAAIPVDVPHRPGLVQLLHCLGQLVAHHVPVRLEHLYEVRQPMVTRASASTSPAHSAPDMQSTSPSAAAAHVPPADDVMSAYWQVMGQFLETNAQVMQQHLSQPRGRQTVIPRRGRRGRGALPAWLAPQPSALPPAEHVEPEYVSAATMPLVGQIVAHEPGQRLVMRRVLDLAEDRYADDHTVGGQHVSKVHPDQHGLPVGPMTFTLEMMAEVSKLFIPELVVTAIKEVKLFKWLAFDPEEPNLVEVTCKPKQRLPNSPEPEHAVELDLRVELLDTRAEGEPKRAVAAAAVVVMQSHYDEPPLAGEFPLTDEHPCRISVEKIYFDLFHGPLLQGIVSVGRCGNEGIEAECEVLPRQGLLASNPNPQFLTDPVFLDVIMHPLSGWHLEQPDLAGRTLLPFELERLDIYGPRPEVGERMTSRVSVDKETTRQYVHSVDAIRPDGRLWCRMTHVKYWRFYMPFGDINFHARKDEYFISRPWNEALPPAAESELFCVQVTPPPDILQPAMQLVAGYITLGPEEKERFRRIKAEGGDRLRWLFVQMAGKDAARLAWYERHGVRQFPADMHIETNHEGRTIARLLDAPAENEFPRVSADVHEGTYAAIAGFTPYVGLALEGVRPHDELNHEELGLLSTFDDRDEAATRIWAAKRAVARAVGAEGSAADCQIEDMDSSGDVLVWLGPTLASLAPELAEQRMFVRTRCEGTLVIATTICGGP
jgi:malonyl CoA-acyl carrier protein transacylase